MKTFLRILSILFLIIGVCLLILGTAVSFSSNVGIEGSYGKAFGFYFFIFGLIVTTISFILNKFSK